MTAALLGTQPARLGGIRPVHTRRDMRAIADLLDLAFTGELDSASRRLVRNMRSAGQAGLLGWLFGHLFLPPAAYPKGFVWEEAGRVVGNASLLAVHGHPERWVLANVAVHPAYRRRGIARGLVKACIDWVKAVNGDTIVLQVKSNNSGAQTLYASEGFQALTTRTSWTRFTPHRLQPPVHDQRIRPRRSGEWRQQWAQAHRLHPEGVLWPYPSSPDLFNPLSLGRILTLSPTRHWLWREGGRLVASLTARLNLDRPGWRLILNAEPEANERVEGPMLRVALSELRPARVRFSLELPAGVAENTLRELDFRPEHTLTWMRLEVDRGLGGEHT